MVTASTALPGFSDGEPVPVTLFAQWTIAGFAPAITGTSIREGSTLTAKPSPSTLAGVTSTYQWLRNGGTIGGATAKTYKLVHSDAGRRVSVRIQATKAGFPVVTKTSARTTVVSSPDRHLVVPSTVNHGASFGVVATGLKPGAPTTIALVGKVVYKGYADQRGIISKTVRFPAAVTAGQRLIRVTTYAKAWTGQTATISKNTTYE
jgi:hypothetical protein